MGYACGATHMNVFVITSSIVITMEFPEMVHGRRHGAFMNGGNDFTKLEQLNDLSRRFCSHPVSAAELRNEFEKINANRPKPLWKLLGSVLAASSFCPFLRRHHSGCHYCRRCCNPDMEHTKISKTSMYERGYFPSLQHLFSLAAPFAGFTLLCPFLHI